jgi:hypothetical protein
MDEELGAKIEAMFVGLHAHGYDGRMVGIKQFIYDKIQAVLQPRAPSRLDSRLNYRGRRPIKAVRAARILATAHSLHL